MGEISGVGLAAIGAGAIFAYGGITGKSPLAALHSILTGTNPNAVAQTKPITLGQLQNNPNSSGQPNSGNPGTRGDQGGNSGVQPSGNRALGKLLAAGYGWTGSEFTALDQLWTRESGWQNDIANSSSGAFGIAQALGHGGSNTAAHNVHVRYPGGSSAVITVNEYPSEAANAGSSQAQIRWGLDYIKGRYGSPSAAWAHETANSWY